MKPAGATSTLLAIGLHAVAFRAANSTGVGDYVAQGLGQTSSTTTSSTTATATVSTALKCPSVNNTQISDRYGVKYTIYCDTYLPADNASVPRTYTSHPNYSQCAPDCDMITGCQGFTWIQDDEGTGTCSFRLNHGLPVATDEGEDSLFSISGRRVGNGTGHGTLGASSTTPSSRSSSTSTITACEAYRTALPNNTLGWYTTGPNLTFSGAVATWSCLPENVPCNLICAGDSPGCISSGSSVAATCSPQWSAYSCSYSSYVSQYVTGSYTTAYGDVFISTVMEYPTTSTANTSFTFAKWGGDTTVITPVYVFGNPRAVSTITSTDSDYGTFTLASSDDFYWSSTTDVEATYGTTYTTAYLDMFEVPLTDLYPVPTPACTITEVYQDQCDGLGGYCNIYGGTVEVFYWPGVTPGPDGNFTNTTKPANPSTTEVSGITMTSPSVYVSFESVYAADSCRQIGAMHTGSILAFDPASISTVTGGPGFLSDDVPNGAAVYNFGDLGPTINAAAYERQVGCVVDTGCSTIYPSYAPTISVPSELLALDPAWSTCYPDFRGFYDPPKALQQQQTIAGPSMYTSATPSPTPASPLPINTGGTDSGSAPSQTTVDPSPTNAGSSPQPAGTQTTSVVDPAASTDSVSQGGTGQSQVTGGASAVNTNVDPSLQTPKTQVTSTADPGGIIGSLFGGDGSSAHGTEQASQANNDPGASTIIVSGTTYALASSGSAVVDGNGVTHTVGFAPGVISSAGYYVDSGQTYTQGPSSNVVVAGNTLGAGSETTISGTTYSLASSASALVVNGVTQSAQSGAQSVGAGAQGIFIANGQTYTEGSSSEVVVAGQTVSPGSQTVISGTTYSLASSGSALVVNGVMHTAESGAQTAGVQGIFVANGESYTEVSSSEVIIGGQTLSPGGETVIDGTTYSLGQSGSALVVNGITQTLQPAQTTGATLTVGSGTYTEDPSISGFVIGSETLTAGGTITVGSGATAETLRMTASNGEVEVVFGTTSTEILGDNAETSGGAHLPSVTTTPPDSSSTTSTAASGSDIANSATNGRDRLQLSTLAVIGVMVCRLLSM